MDAVESTDVSHDVLRATTPMQGDPYKVANLSENNLAEEKTEADKFVTLYEAIRERKDQGSPLVSPWEVASDGLQRELADEQRVFRRSLEVLQLQSFLASFFMAFFRWIFQQIPTTQKFPKRFGVRCGPRRIIIIFRAFFH